MTAFQASSAEAARERPASCSIAAKGLWLGYGARRRIVRELDLDLPAGAVTAIIGPNGCGKSTLLRGLARLIAPQAGTVVLDGHDLHRLPTRDVARRIGLLPQAPTTPDGITVGDLVRRGRAPHTSLWRQWSAVDQAAVDRALATTEMTRFTEEQVDTLSGGQRQRAWLAMVVAQDTPLLLLDEPTSYLDMAHQLDVLELIRDLHRVGSTVVMVLHDVNHAARYADHIVALRDGSVIAQGAPTDLLTPALLHEVFGVHCSVLTDPATGSPVVVPVARHDRPATGTRQL